MDSLEQIKNLNSICDLFENVNECVYISNVGTHELVYMNKRLRDSLGFTQHEDYAGKKCYELLQKSDHPCTFCTNVALRKERKLSWVQKNPILQKNFLVTDGLFRHNGQTYRIEVAVDTDTETAPAVPFYYAHGESILNECFQKMVSTDDPEEALRRILASLGRMFGCGSAYIFELNGDKSVSTYRWRENEEMPQRLLFQSVPSKELARWLSRLRSEDSIAVADLESISGTYPASYAALKAQNIDRMCVGAIYDEENLIGFIGLGNPAAEMLVQIPLLLKMLGHFIALLIKRRDRLQHLKTLSYYDLLTGALNQNAFLEQQNELNACDTLGVVVCSVREMSRINELFGSEACNTVLRRCCRTLQETCRTSRIYRISGGEFLALYQNADKDLLLADIEKLNDEIRKSDYRLDMGYEWTDKKPVSVEHLLERVRRCLHQDRQMPYALSDQKAQAGRYGAVSARTKAQDELLTRPLHTFLDSVYFDPECFIQAIAQKNATSYFYMGDMQKDLYYISDNMRDDFGFSHNVVPSLLSLWEQRISDQTARELYRQDIRSMLEEKRTVHDLRYRVKDVSGNIIWIHCYGLLKWDEEQTKPLFFSGRVTRQDNEFMVDPTTNFHFTQTMLRLLDTARTEQKKFLAIGIGFNHITEVNSARGRMYSDHLIQCIAASLAEEFSGQMTFYRLEGMRCIALAELNNGQDRESLVHKILDIVNHWYHTMGISVQNPCSFAIMEYPCGQFVPTEFLDTMLTLIRTAKRNPAYPYMTYSPENLAAAKEASDLELALNRDVMNGMENFRIVVQPIVDAKTSRICGGEVLLRWQYQGKSVSPAVFVPILEKENMIQKAGRWVFEKTVRACQLLRVYVPDIYLSFNVSLQQLSDSQFPEFMRQTLEHYKLDATHLVAEMTESCMDEQPELLMRFVNVCAAIGMRIALDDFGSGYSSMKMLLRYPTNVIKLDRSLLSEMMESDHKLNFISSIVYACHRVGKTVCMEGVETAEQAAQIKEVGCDMVQGFYFHRPMELDDLYGMLNERQRGE